MMQGKQHIPWQILGLATGRARRWHKTVVLYGCAASARIIQTNIDVASGATAFFLHLGKVRALIPVRFGVVVVGERVKARSVCTAASDYGIRHTHDRR